jgi:hypothetical protein
MEEDKLYIPMGLKEKKEHFNGFGDEELLKTLITILGLNVLNLIIFLTTKSTTFTSVYFLTSLGAAVMFYTKDSVNLSMYDKLRNSISFMKSQKRYDYIYLDEWR